MAMMIKQLIKYNSDGTYFAGFLQSLIDESGISGSVSQDEHYITLKLDASQQKEAEVFDGLCAKYLPHSLFVDAIETKPLEFAITPSKFRSQSYEIAPCPKCLELLINPASELYLDDNVVCNHYSNEGMQISDTATYTPHYTDQDTLLVVDSSKINELFYITQKEQEVLFSIEKPTIKVTIKDETLKELTGKNFINIKAPFSIKSSLVALNAKESEISYLFFDDPKPFKVVVVQENVTIIEDKKGISRSLQALDQDDTINRFLNIKQEAGFSKNCIGTYLSTHGISFLVSNELGNKKVLSLGEFDLGSSLKKMKTDPKRSKLLENFASKRADYAEFEDMNSQDIFAVVAKILELKEESFEALSDKALEFRGNGGLKIDMFFDDKGFDYESFLGSIISFYLAGAETHYLAYSIFESFGDMAITTLTQIQKKFHIDNFVMMGDMFANNVLYSRILSKFQMQNPYFSKAIALDR